MGTENETAALQRQIKTVLTQLGWSQNEFSRRFYVEETSESDYDDQAELRAFQERFKKELQRPTTDPLRLRRYLDYLITHPNAEKLDVSLNRPTPLGEISEELRMGLAAISAEIDKTLK